VIAPQKNHRVGKWLNVKKWKLWDAWIRFLAIEVILDQPRQNQHRSDGRSGARTIAGTPLASEILAFIPHGIFPFAFGVGALTDWAQRIFGSFRPIVASAVLKVPIFGDLVGMIHGLDASKTEVDRALAHGERVGVIPGGISEMFTGYPRSGCHPDEEYAIVRKGFLRMALRHQKPVIPIFCFGSTKLFRRLELGGLEKLSEWLRISLIVFYGIWGLPIPFRQRLTYIVGEPIAPPLLSGEEAQVNAMHDAFCGELHRLFERHKDAYGWGHKTLTLLSK
jgi:2-acylglycerol O-acyltransferase 2